MKDIEILNDVSTLTNSKFLSKYLGKTIRFNNNSKLKISNLLNYITIVFTIHLEILLIIFQEY